MTVQLPPPSPALQLHQAAEVLRRSAQAAVAAMARNDYWAVGWARGVTNAIGGPEGELAALLSPDAALTLADALDTVGSEAARRLRDAVPVPLAVFAGRVVEAPREG
ncbi:hypothetical protein [Streptomyces sp. SID8499]|uniref:hypothetical protein n=1 Tax=Streptomyces sp. SID8499 TaxID=2706106 RepID=UPI0013CCAA4E|nr:hypothetical protein [Streptomyces sp. SID8499]NED31042.1 hypothetical protein [Streptomyces sp. SID8499]